MTAEIKQWLIEEEKAFFTRHKRYPIGREIEDVVDNVFPMVERKGIKVTYAEVYEYYRMTAKLQLPGIAM